MRVAGGHEFILCFSHYNNNTALEKAVTAVGGVLSLIINRRNCGVYNLSYLFYWARNKGEISHQDFHLV